MCSFEKRDLLLWINHEDFDGKVMLRLQATPDKRGYNDYFTVDRLVEGGKGAERLFTIPFREIMDIAYTTSSASSGECCTLFLDLIGGESSLREIKVDRHCFDYLAVRKMISVFRKSKKAGML